MKREISYIYSLRIFAIFSVIMLHCITPYVFNPLYFGTKSYYFNLITNSVVRTGVPIFLMISGVLILGDDLTGNVKAFYKKRIPKLLIPLLSRNVIYYFFSLYMTNGTFSFKALVDGILGNGNGYHLWYLYTLIALYLLAPFIKNVVDNRSVSEIMVFMFLLGFCTTFRPLINNTISPYYVYLFDPLGNGYSLFFVAGYLIDRLKFTKIQKTVLLLLGVLGLCISAFGNHNASSENAISFIHNGGFDISAFLFAIGIFSLFRMTVKSAGTFTKTLSGISYGMYFIHVAIIEIILKHFMINASPLVSELYIFVITVLASVLFAYVIRKIKILN